MEVRGRSRWLAALRTLLVAVCVCLLGAASRSDQSGLAANLTLQEAGSAHAEAIGLPLPGPAVVEDPGEDPRSAKELTPSPTAHARASPSSPPAPRQHARHNPRPARRPRRRDVAAQELSGSPRTGLEVSLSTCPNRQVLHPLVCAPSKAP